MTMLKPTPTLTLYRAHGEDLSDLARVNGIAERDAPWFVRDLNAHLSELTGIEPTTFVAFHVDAPSSFCRPIGTGPLPGVEIRAFARAMAEAMLSEFVAERKEVA